MNLDPAYSIYAFGLPARRGDISAFLQRYSSAPAGYLDLVKERTSVVLLWNRRSELRLWGPEEVLGMDDAYGASDALPGMIPIGDNGGGKLLIHGPGERGTGLYLADTGALFFEDADWVSPDLKALLERGEGAGAIFLSDPLEESALAGTPFLEEREYR